MLKRFAAAWRFLTILPFPLSAGEDEAEQLGRSVGMFPAVGLILGMALALAVWILGMIFPSLVTGALAVALLAGVSGGFHLDGFADSADALLSPGHDRDKALAVMRDSRIGAHGAASLVLLLLLKFACLASLSPNAMPYVVAVMPLAGRTGMLFPIAMLPYLREKGLGSFLRIDNSSALLAKGCLWVGLGMVVALGPLTAGIGFVIWAGSMLLWVGYLARRLGGATGDTYGAACEFGEAALCLAAVMKI